MVFLFKTIEASKVNVTAYTQLITFLYRISRKMLKIKLKLNIYKFYLFY